MRRKGSNPETNQQSHKDFRVRRQAIQQGLQYLQVNHPTYRSRAVQISEANLASLPEDDSVYSRLRTIETEEYEDRFMQETGPAEDNEPAGPANLPQEAPDSMFSAGFVPNVRIDASEMEQLRQAVNNPTSMQPLGDNPLQYAFPEDSPIILSLPVVRGTPVSEHRGTSIDIDAFPTLFPNGKGSFQSVREAPVTLQEWAGHLIRLDGGRFAQHPRFRYWVLNTIMRQTAKKASSWYCTKNPQDKALTVEEIREMLADNTVRKSTKRRGDNV
jgi:hypothetical protein